MNLECKHIWDRSIPVYYDWWVWVENKNVKPLWIRQCRKCKDLEVRLTGNKEWVKARRKKNDKV